MVPDAVVDAGRSIGTLYPPEVVTYETSSLDTHQTVYPEEEVHIANASTKRQREFRAGRCCLRIALSRMSVTDYPILVGDDRSPRLPDGIVGSLSHTECYCGVALARKGAVLSLGLDVETVGHTEPDVWRHILTRSESEWIESLPYSQQLWYRHMIFSAKESLYKCEYQLTRRWLGFHDVEIAPDITSGIFDVRFLSDVGRASADGYARAGRYLFKDVRIFTAVTLASYDW